jgi:hypothetical protein
VLPPPRPGLIDTLDGGALAGTPHVLESWLADLPRNHSLSTIKALTARLVSIRERESNVRMQLKLLDLVTEAAAGPLRTAESEITGTGLPLEAHQQQLVKASQNLLMQLAAAYLEIAERVAHRWMAIGFARPLRSAAFNGAACVLHSIEFGYRACAHAEAACWHRLMAFHRIAAAHQFADQPARETSAETVLTIHARALLLAVIDPTRFTPGEVDRLRFYLQRHAGLAHFSARPAGTDDETTVGLLVLADNGRPATPLARLGGRRMPPGALLLDCRSLIEKLHLQIDGLQRGEPPTRLGLPLAARQSSYAALLGELHAKLAEAPSRRFKRSRFLPRADLVAGFDAIAGFLEGGGLRRRRDERPPQAPTREARDSEWAISDESPGGFCLRHISGYARHVAVGELIALRPREQARIQLGIVRRAVNDPQDGFVLGIESLAARAIVVRTELALDGGPAAPMTLFILPRTPTLGGRTALVAPRAALPAGTPLEFSLGGQRRRVATGAARATFSTCELLPLMSLR